MTGYSSSLPLGRRLAFAFGALLAVMVTIILVTVGGADRVIVAYEGAAAETAAALKDARAMADFGEERRVQAIGALKRQDQAAALAALEMGAGLADQTPLRQSQSTEAGRAAAAAAEHLGTLMSFVIGGLGLLGAALAVASSVLISRSVAQPVAAMTAAMGRLAAGDVDTPVPDPAGLPEMAAMARALAVFKDQAVAKRRADQAAAAQAGQDLAAARAAEAQSARERLAAETRAGALAAAIGEFNGTVSAILGGLETAAAGLGQAGSAFSGAMAATGEEARLAEDAAVQAAMNVQSVAGATEEISASVREITRQIGHAADGARGAVNVTGTARDEVSDLDQAAARIGDIIASIAVIAAKTDLLALNATIEAARAGPAGRGFAVVASEVKALASHAASASADITAQVGAIQASTRRAVTAMGTIAEAINGVDQGLSAIAAAADEQGAATTEIARNTVEAADRTRDVSGMVASLRGHAGQAGDEARVVTTAAEDLRGQAMRLRTAVDLFLGQVRGL